MLRIIANNTCVQAFVLLLALFMFSTNGWAAAFKTVVVVSIDALHPAALTEAHAPLTCALLEKGHLTRRGQSTNPPKTLIGHAAMMTGISPQDGGRTSNEWSPGEPTVQGKTIFHIAKRRGYRTGYFYSKPKLGFLMSDAVDQGALSPDDATGKAAKFLSQGGKQFVFVHVSGLDIVGPEHGWMSRMYLEELSYIDQYLEEVYAALQQAGPYLLIITSDHAGFEKSHGGSHPDEAKVPFGVVSDVCRFKEVDDAPYKVTDLPEFLWRAMLCEVPAKP